MTNLTTNKTTTATAIIDIEQLARDVMNYADKYADYSEATLDACTDAVNNWAKNKSYLLEKLSACADWSSKDLAIIKDIEIVNELNSELIDELINSSIRQLLKASYNLDITLYSIFYMLYNRNLYADYNYSELLFNSDTTMRDALNEAFKKLNIAVKIKNNDNIKTISVKLLYAVASALKQSNTNGDSNKADDVTALNILGARLSDAISNKATKYKLIISVHPLAYLGASVSDNFNSCYNIDGGCYCAGTLAYMQDKQTITTFLIKADDFDADNIYDNRDKVIRQYLHYVKLRSDTGDTITEAVIPARIYPASDGVFYRHDEPGKYRNYYNATYSVFKDVSSVLLNDTDIIYYQDSDLLRRAHLHGNGYNDLHYDYCNNNELFIRASDREKITANAYDFYYGTSNALALDDGAVIENEDCIYNIGCHYCADCGCRIYDDDYVMIDGDYYCMDCVTYCEDIDEYVRNDDAVYSEYENRDISRDNATWVESIDDYVSDAVLCDDFHYDESDSCYYLLDDCVYCDDDDDFHYIDNVYSATLSDGDEHYFIDEDARDEAVRNDNDDTDDTDDSADA